MSFLLDTDICSAYLKGHHAIANRFVQYGGRLNLSTANLGELYSWALRAKASPTRMQKIIDMLAWVQILDVNHDAARRFGEIDAFYLDNGLSADDVDVFNAAVALNHGLTMVTHNTKDYLGVQGLAVVDWLGP